MRNLPVEEKVDGDDIITRRADDNPSNGRRVMICQITRTDEQIHYQGFPSNLLICFFFRMWNKVDTDLVPQNCSSQTKCGCKDRYNFGISETRLIGVV